MLSGENTGTLSAFMVAGCPGCRPGESAPRSGLGKQPLAHRSAPRQRRQHGFHPSIDYPGGIEGDATLRQIGAFAGNEVETPEVARADQSPVLDDSARQRDVTVRAAVQKGDVLAIIPGDDAYPVPVLSGFSDDASDRPVPLRLLDTADTLPAAAHLLHPSSAEIRAAVSTMGRAR